MADIQHYYGTPDYFEQLALGKVPNKSSIYKFGRAENVGATTQIVSTGVVYGVPTSAETVTVASDDVGDAYPSGAGTR